MLSSHMDVLIEKLYTKSFLSDFSHRVSKVILRQGCWRLIIYVIIRIVIKTSLQSDFSSIIYSIMHSFFLIK